MSDEPRETRRGYLAFAGTAATAALAGCNRLGLGSDEERTTLDGEALEAAVPRELPSIPEPEPVDVERSYLEETAAGVRETLDSVPAPFDATEIPNGAIRSELDAEYDRATDYLEEWDGAESAPGKLGRLRGARTAAAAVEAGWRAIDADRGIDAVTSAAQGVRGDLESFRRRWRYVGDDPVRAVLAHAALEERVATAGRLTTGVGERSRHDSETALGVAEAASDVAGARAALTDGAYLYDRFDASLDDPRRVGRGLRAASRSLVSTLDERRASLPTADDPSSYVEPDVQDTPAEHALRTLRDVEYADGLEDERASGRRASVVLSVHETLVRVRAFERLQARVDDGGYEAVSDVEGVERRHRAAAAALESAVASESAPRLTRYVLHQVGRSLEYASEEVRRKVEREEVWLDSLNRDVGQFLAVEAMARATPETSAAVADVLRREL